MRWYTERGGHRCCVRELFVLIVKDAREAISALEAIIVALVVGWNCRWMIDYTDAVQWLMASSVLLLVVVDIIIVVIIVFVVNAAQHAIRGIGRLHLHLHGGRVRRAFHLLHLDMLAIIVIVIILLSLTVLS